MFVTLVVVALSLFNAALGQQTFHKIEITRNARYSNVEGQIVSALVAGQCHLEVLSRGLAAFAKSKLTDECVLYTPSDGQEPAIEEHSDWDLYYKNVTVECNATLGNTCYVAVSGLRPYAASVAYCPTIATGAHMVDVLSEEENTLVANILQAFGDGSPVYLDATTVATSFHWVTRAEILSYTNWYGSEPSGGEGCLEMSGHPDYLGLWNDVHCTDPRHTICEIEN